jgi:uncharacterized protein YgbK (DUF1537 family)
MAVLSDDLTSATDGIAGFAERGLCAHVVRAPRGLRNRDALEHADVLAVDVSSRGMQSTDAVHHVGQAAVAVADAPILVKQFDSTLRGHVAAECLAMLRATKREQLVVAPAFPSAGRTTLGGEQRVHGIAVHETAYARDLMNPVLSSDLRHLFKAEGARVARREGDRGTVTILDSATEADLDRIAEMYIDRSDVLLAGSTGLLRAVARVWRGHTSVEARSHPVSHRCLVVVGSLNALSREQLARLRETSAPVVTVLHTDDSAAVERRVESEFAAGHRVVALSSSTDVHTTPRLVGRQIAEMVGRLTDDRVIDGLVVTGGDTLGSVLHHLHSELLTVHCEIEPGIPVCTISQPYVMPLVSKAGGFGSSDILVKAANVLAGLSAEAS